MQKRFGFVMPVFTPSEKTLKRAIDSLIDQLDYENWKLIVVFDGENKEGEEIVKSIDDLRIQWKVIEHAGVCAARNAGAEELLKDADVAYLSFFSSDFIALPGMISTWAREFDAHEDCGMVYGGYDLIKDGEPHSVYYSEPFDIDNLKSHPYIDGGFPVKRECYQPWDVNCKSLNDWEWTLRLVLSGVKCCFMNNRTYSAEMPKEGGLSADSSKNWVERVSYIREKLGIPENPVCFVSFGAPFHAKRLAKLCGQDYLPHPAMKPNKYKMIYLMGYYSLETTQAFGGSATNPEVVKVAHWIGSDVLAWKGFPYLQIEMAKEVILNKIDYSLSEYPYTKLELKNMGIEGKTQAGSPMVPTPVSVPEVMYPLPEEFTVAVYMPTVQGAVTKYHLDLINSVIKASPDIKFVLFGGDKGTAGNVEGMGWCDTQEVIKKSSMLLRLTEHDGMPVSAVEFMLQGRQVLTNTPMPYAEIYNTYLPYYMSDIAEETMVDHKDRLINRLRRLKKVPNTIYAWDKIKAFYADFCSLDRFKRNIQNMLERKAIEEPVVDDVYYVNGDMLNGLNELSKGRNVKNA
jgi:glycosyltransferase involved in cell wall biosynthesis